MGHSGKGLPQWPTKAAPPTAVTHGGKVTANGRVQGVGPAAPYRRAPRAVGGVVAVGHGPTVVGPCRRGGRRRRRPPSPTLPPPLFPSATARGIVMPQVFN
jgi:hypothetical protein